MQDMQIAIQREVTQNVEVGIQNGLKSLDPLNDALLKRGRDVEFKKFLQIMAI